MLPENVGSEAAVCCTLRCYSSLRLVFFGLLLEAAFDSLCALSFNRRGRCVFLAPPGEKEGGSREELPQPTTRPRLASPKARGDKVEIPVPMDLAVALNWRERGREKSSQSRTSFLSPGTMI